MANAEINLQWKGTDACYDFYCPCGMDDDDLGLGNHCDGLFQQWFACSGCGRVWCLPNRIAAVEVSAVGVFPSEGKP